MVTYFKNQKDFTLALISLIDLYWGSELKEDELVAKAKELIGKNEEKVYRKGDYQATLKQRLGKRRLDLLIKILK